MSWWDFAEFSGYPGNDLDVHRIACPFCDEKGNFSTIHHEKRSHSGTGKVLNYDTVKCGNCANLMMVFWTASSSLHDFKCVPWSRETTRFPDHWPADVGRFWMQARRSLEGKNWDAAALMARSAVQLIVRYQDGEGNNLKQEIDDLGSKGILPPIMVEWSHEIRVLGNESAHPAPGERGADQRDAQDVVEFLGQLLSTTYDLPHAIEQYRGRRKK
jgi:hypothetical protein